MINSFQNDKKWSRGGSLEVSGEFQGGERKKDNLAGAPDVHFLIRFGSFLGVNM